jgi:xylulokinase
LARYSDLSPARTRKTAPVLGKAGMPSSSALRSKIEGSGTISGTLFTVQDDRISFGRENCIPVLGIDVGTGGSRALVIGDDGSLLASATADHQAFTSQRPAWAEQDPADWWSACQRAIRSVLSEGGVNPQQINCIGLTGQMHGTVLLDQDGRVLRPAIIWCDQRGEEQCAWVENHIGAERLLSLTCNPALPNFTLIKLLWIREHEPDVWDRVRHVLLPKDYVRFCLSGAHATDVADASGTLLLDVARRCWSQDLLRQVNMDLALLPRVFESTEICGHVTGQAAQLTGLQAGTPIVAGAGDQAAGAVGMGVTRPGRVSITIGTSGVVFAATQGPALDPQGRLHTFCHAVPGRWHVMGVTQAAGLSLRWLRSLLGYDWTYERMTEEAAVAPPGADGLLWAPYLMGERTPHLDPNIRGGLVGLSASHTRAHIIRAVMEGVAFSLRDSLSILAELNLPLEKIRLGGGGARSPLWRQIQADVYNHDVEILASEEGAALGAAILAGVGAGIWPDVDEACDRVIRSKESIARRPEIVLLMDQRYGEYRRLYPALREIYARSIHTAS